MVVLILTQDFDPTVDPVVRSLTAKGARVARVDLGYFPRTMTLTASDFDGRRVLRHGDREVDLRRLSGVWYRRPTDLDVGHLGAAERQFALAEAYQGVGGILRATDCLWVNRPEADATAEMKPYQLAAAKKAGLRVPRTLLTNDPAAVSALCEAAERPIVYKSLRGLVHKPTGLATVVPTTVVGGELLANLDRVRHTMCTFQEYIDKAYEIRLTVIGDTYFPVVMRSQDSEATRVDWRSDQRQLRYGDFEPLPERVVDRIQALLGELGLAYAALDLIVTPEGEYVFLEANPGGQFMWLEEELRLPLADRMADLLMAGGPVRRGPVTQVGY